MLALALIPGILLIFAVWKLDTVEKESPVLLLKLFVAGVLVMLVDILLRSLGLKMLEGFYDGTSIMFFTFLDAFIFTALIEEGGRFIALKLLTWKDKEFNYTFDAIVYVVSLSVGFLIAENVVLMIKYGSAVDPARLIIPLLVQIVISIFMGYFYGLAKVAEGKGDLKAKKTHMMEAIIIPIVFHGIFEMCEKSGSVVFFIIFVIYVLIMTSAAVAVFINARKSDTAIEWDSTDMKEGDEFEMNVTSLLDGSEKTGEKGGEQ